MTIDAWAGAHPLLKALPVDWSHKMSYGVPFPRATPGSAAVFGRAGSGHLPGLQEKGPRLITRSSSSLQPPAFHLGSGRLDCMGLNHACGTSVHWGRATDAPEAGIHLLPQETGHQQGQPDRTIAEPPAANYPSGLLSGTRKFSGAALVVISN